MTLLLGISGPRGLSAHLPAPSLLLLPPPHTKALPQRPALGLLASATARSKPIHPLPRLASRLFGPVTIWLQFAAACCDLIWAPANTFTHRLKRRSLYIRPKEVACSAKTTLQNKPLDLWRPPPFAFQTPKQQPPGVFTAGKRCHDPYLAARFTSEMSPGAGLDSWKYSGHDPAVQRLCLFSFSRRTGLLPTPTRYHGKEPPSISMNAPWVPLSRPAREHSSSCLSVAFRVPLQLPNDFPCIKRLFPSP
ncbi:hypothetical protein K432DRAFT_378266 [Lepidopterella palustris CBS 459.81]|uniref:Uncharacterized protein n=1 Tax=Lepidopterella palustris CBS 459.81 TaxID=1314670 RepID=A0A8E2EIW5_9PEZI|nr:hypothetical protein K432DRAFT_378266 [Lepidopterella palustris CBS 459.81]